MSDEIEAAEAPAPVKGVGDTVFGVLLFHYLLSIPFPLLRGFNL